MLKSILTQVLTYLQDAVRTPSPIFVILIIIILPIICLTIIINISIHHQVGADPLTHPYTATADSAYTLEISDSITHYTARGVPNPSPVSHQSRNPQQPSLEYRTVRCLGQFKPQFDQSCAGAPFRPIDLSRYIRDGGSGRGLFLTPFD